MNAFESFDPRSLAPPTPSPVWLEPRGVARLGAMPAPLLLIEAGPGFGKTALMAELHTEALARGDAAVWLDLSAGTPDGDQLLKRIVLGFARGPLGARSAALALAVTEPEIPTWVLLRVLLAEIDALSQCCVLFIDGLCWSTESEDMNSVHDLVRALASHPSPRFRLQVCGRAGIIDGLRRSGEEGRGQRCLTAGDLLLDREQVETLLARHLHVPIDAVLADKIHDEVRGWPAGVMRAVEVLRKTRSPRLTERFLRSWQDVLDQGFEQQLMTTLTPAEHAYLAHASQFHIFTDALIAAVMGQAPGESVNHADLTAKGALLEPVEASHNGPSSAVPLRCHPAFRRYLETALVDRLTPAERRFGQQESVKLLKGLGFHADAVEVLIQLGELGAAAELIENHCEVILERTDAERIRSWRVRFEPGQLGPLALVTLAWSELLGSDLAAAVELAAAARMRKTEGSRQKLLAAHLLVLELGLAALQDDLSRVTGLIDRWEDGFADVDSAWLNHHMSNARSYVAMHSGKDMPPPRGAVSWRQQDEADLPMVVRHCYQARASLLAGRFDLAESEIRRGEDAARLLPDRMAAARWLPLTVMGLLAWERGDLGLIASRLEPRLPEILASTLIAHRHDAVTALARARGAQGDFNGALELLAVAKSGPAAGMPQRFALELDREQLRIRCFQDELGSAEALLAAMRDRADVARQQSPQQYENVARILMSSEGLLAYALGQHEHAHERLSELLKAHVSRGDVGRYPSVQTMGLMVATLWKLGREAEALGLIDRILRMAQAGSIRQSLLDWRSVIDAPLTAYVEKHADHDNPLRDYALGLLGVGGEADAEAHDPTDAEDVLSSLSRRERQVLSLAATGLSTKTIARQLHVSPNTVKWHLKNAYDKTGVRNRAAASRLFPAQ